MMIDTNVKNQEITVQERTLKVLILKRVMHLDLKEKTAKDLHLVHPDLHQDLQNHQQVHPDRHIMVKKEVIQTEAPQPIKNNL
jgi:hypothetical protein